MIGAGDVGPIGIRALQERPEIELVGVWSRSLNIGIDAGLLDSNEPCGILIRSDEESIFALEPDCAIMALNIRDPREGQSVNGRWFTRFLERGVNIVAASDGGLVYPLRIRPSIRRPARKRRDPGRRHRLYEQPGTRLR